MGDVQAHDELKSEVQRTEERKEEAKRAAEKAAETLPNEEARDGEHIRQRYFILHNSMADVQTTPAW